MSEAHARWSDPETSHEAARSVVDLRASQLAVLAVLREHGPMTDTDLIRAYHDRTPQQSSSGIRTRRKELVDSGEVEDSGQRALLPSGRRSIIWRVTTGAPRMQPREGTTDELRAGMYVRSAKGTTYRVVSTTASEIHLVDRNGVAGSMPKPFDPRPCTIMEPTEAEALATLAEHLGAEVEAVREAPGEPFRVVGLGNVLSAWHTHMFMFHGIWTKSGPGSKSLDKIRAAHDLDHEDAAAGHPTGAYVAHRH